MRILVVDDELLEILLIRRMFEPSGYEITGAESGVEALEILKHYSDFDIFLVYELIAAENDYSFLRELKSDLPHIPVILWSINTDSPRSIGACKNGADSIVRYKPSIREEMIETFQKAVNRTP
jgi:CheY-like chemotaxis protein